ncbi:MAG TPA: response regulator [Nitriliruptorales bacterium]|nr:response regulator [Nitriliruptorales bacterium]
MTNILVVDDDPGIRGVLEVALSDYRTLFAEDGVEALELLARQRVDLILLDLMMPRLDGIETLRRIRGDARLRDIPVVLLTARVGEDDHLRGYQAGADAYITKPFDPEDLVSVVEEVRGRSPEARLRIRESEKAKAALLRQVERRFR